MKKIAFYLLVLSVTTIQAAVYQGRTAYIGFCKDCHGNGTKMAKAYTGDQWRAMLDKKGVRMSRLHLDNADAIATKIAQKQANGLLPYSTLKTVKEYFQNKSEIILKSMSRSEKKATKKRIYKYQSRHLKDFFVEFSKDSGKVPACSDDGAGGESKAELEQARRIQDAERQRRAKKSGREKSKLLLAQTRVNETRNLEAEKRAKAQKQAREDAKKRQTEKARKVKNKKIQVARANKAKAKKKERARKARKKAKKTVTRKQLANHKRKSRLSVNEQIVDLVDGKLSKSDLNKLKILLLSK